MWRSLDVEGFAVLLLDGMLGLIVLGLMIFCLLDAISTDEYACRNLSKIVWVLLILFFPLVGSIAWLVAGRPQSEASSSMPYKGNHGHPSMFPEYDRPGRAMATNPDDDEAFLRGLRERAEQQRRVYREQRQRELGEQQRRELDEGDSTTG
jgi:hypothetical protein